MKKEIIKIKNTGIDIIQKKLNKKLNYIAKENVYIKNNYVYCEEHDSIIIDTDISTEKELITFINEASQTDLFTMFDTIDLNLNINDFYNGKNYITIKHCDHGTYEAKPYKTYYTVVIKTNPDDYFE